MVFFTGVGIAMLMYYWQQSGLMFALCIALAAELVYLVIINNVIKSLEKRLTTKYTKIIDKLKKEALSSTRKEREFRKTDKAQKDQIAAQESKVRELNIKLEVFKKQVDEQDEVLSRLQNLPRSSTKSKLKNLKV